MDDVGFKLGAPTLHARWPLLDDAMPVAPGGLGGLWWVLICLAPGGLNSVQHIPSQCPVHQRAPTSTGIHKDGRLLNLFGPEMHSAMLDQMWLTHASTPSWVSLDSLPWPLTLLGHDKVPTVGPSKIPSFPFLVYMPYGLFFDTTISCRWKDFWRLWCCTILSLSDWAVRA